jgi:hypothetical protein
LEENHPEHLVEVDWLLVLVRNFLVSTEPSKDNSSINLQRN